MAKKPDMPPNDQPENAPRLFLSAGHGGHDPGACANGFTEALLTVELRDRVKAELLALGADPARILTDADNWDFPTTLAFFAANCRKPDALLEIHFNAGPPAAAGTETYVRIGATAAESTLGDRLSAAVSAALATPNRGRKPENNSQHSSLAVLHYAGTSCLLEVEFVTNRAAINNYAQKQAVVAKAIAAELHAQFFTLHA